MVKKAAELEGSTPKIKDDSVFTIHRVENNLYVYINTMC